MSALGLEFNRNSAGLFVWGKIPADYPIGAELNKTLGERLSDDILYSAGVFITPGFIFGKNGNNYLRISLCADVETLCRAEKALREWLSQTLQNSK